MSAAGFGSQRYYLSGDFRATDKLYRDADFLFQLDLALVSWVACWLCHYCGDWQLDHGWLCSTAWSSGREEEEEERNTRPNNTAELKGTIKANLPSLMFQRCHLIDSMPHTFRFINYLIIYLKIFHYKIYRIFLVFFQNVIFKLLKLKVLIIKFSLKNVVDELIVHLGAF